MYNSLTKEEDNSIIKNFLQEIVEQDVLDSALMDQLAIDVGQKRKMLRNPALIMEARHKQVPLSVMILFLHLQLIHPTVSV